jgi:hypothetical protein
MNQALYAHMNNKRKRNPRALYLASGAHDGRMWAPMGLHSPMLIVLLVAAHMASLSGWLCSLPVASFLTCPTFLASLSS